MRVATSFPIGHVDLTKGWMMREATYDTRAAILSFLDCLFNAKDQVRPTCADVGTKNIRSVAFIVYTQSELHVGIRHLRWIAEAVDGQAANSGKMVSLGKQREWT